MGSPSASALVPVCAPDDGQEADYSGYDIPKGMGDGYVRWSEHAAHAHAHPAHVHGCGLGAWPTDGSPLGVCDSLSPALSIEAGVGKRSGTGYSGRAWRVRETKGVLLRETVILEPLNATEVGSFFDEAINDDLLSVASREWSSCSPSRRFHSSQTFNEQV